MRMPASASPRGRDRDLDAANSQSSSTSTSPERRQDDDDDADSFIQDPNESQSSLEVSLEEMELDPIDPELQRKICPISRLPAELMISIFSKLTSPADVLSCLLTCKSWARNSVELLWHRPRTDKWDKFEIVLETLKKRGCYFAYWELIKRLNLTSLHVEVGDQDLAILNICKRVERLTLTNCTSLTDASIASLISKNSHLFSLDLCGVDKITDITLAEVSMHCYRLQGLNVGNCKKLTDASMAEVAKTCKRLKRVKLNFCDLLTDTTMKAFARNCPDIVEFDVAGCNKITDVSVGWLVQECKQLRELRLSYCSALTDGAFTRLSSLQQYEALRILDLTDCSEIGDAALQRISYSFPRLRTIVLAKCRAITDRGIMAMKNLGKNLHFVHLGHCARITDYGLSHLVRACNRIRYIDLACCTNLTDESVKLLADLPKLKRIGLVKCLNITDRSIMALSEPKPSHSNSNNYHPAILERLHLSYCTNLTIMGVRMMLLNCPRLTHLSLTGVQEFLREDLLQFCRDAPPDFTDHQRDVFCVFSGQKVHELRKWLRDNYPTPPSSETPSEADETHDAFGPPTLPPHMTHAWPQTAPNHHHLAPGHQGHPAHAHTQPFHIQIPPPPPPIPQHTNMHADLLNHLQQQYLAQQAFLPHGQQPVSPGGPAAVAQVVDEEGASGDESELMGE